MKKKKNIFILIFIILIVVTIIIIYESNKEYKYVCFNVNMAKGDSVSENLLDECTSNNRLPKGVLTNKKDLIIEEEYSWYKTLKEYNKGEMIYQKDLEVYQSPKSQETIIELLTEVEVLNHGNSEESLTKYKAYVKNNKLYAINLKTNEEKVIFEQEKVDKIAIRPFCCAGDAWLLILTTTGNVYISDKDCHYAFSFDFSFTKLNVKDIKSFKLIPAYDYDPVKNLYGINSTGEEILLQKIN